jgi:type I restriction enzyme M protein
LAHRELLFVENIYNLLKMGGTAGVIVPQGVLFGSGKAFVEARKILIDKCELKAVITMPSGVFKPYAGVSTAILIFTKGGETENVWFYDMQSDGYSLDDKRAKLEGYGDLQDIVTQYKKRDQLKDSDMKEKYFFVAKDKIVAENYDLSMSKYKEDVFEDVVYEKPDVILGKLKVLEREIEKEMGELEGMLG